MDVLQYFSSMMFYGFIGSFAVFTVLWWIQVIRKDAGVVDIGWTAGVGAMAICAAILGDGWMPRRVLLGAMGGIWSLRLVLYILKDRILSQHEDSRYQRLRARWDGRANRMFFFFFTSQSLLVVLFALPFLPGANNRKDFLTSFDVLALITWSIAMFGEWLSDLQLARFRNNPNNKGKVCRTGLWNWSRHPNYFFEWIHWFAYVFLALGSPGFELSLIGPVVMYIFLVKLTGVPHAEREALAKRGDAYREYQQSTRLLVPWPKKRKTV